MVENRRRLLQGSGIVRPPYPDPWEDDGRVWCYYNVTTTESATVILNNVNAGFGSTMEVDGVSVPLARTYTFDTTGEHLVKFILTNPTTISGANGQRWREVFALKRCYLPDGITKIPGLTFFGRVSAGYNLQILHIPESVQVWGDSGQLVIYEGYNIKGKVNLPNLTTCYSSFSRCGYSEIKIGDDVSSLPADMFRQCYATKTIDLGSGITNIGAQFVYEAESLETITIRALTPPTLGANPWRNNYALRAIYVPSESVQAYKQAAGWSSYANKIQAI